MTTQYTPILQLALPITGELNGTWGNVVNTSITSMIEQAIAGKATISTWSGVPPSHTLTTANGASDEARCAILELSDTPGAAAELICPARTKMYVVKNAVSGGFAVTVKTASGTGVSVPNGKIMLLYCDGTNVVAMDYTATAAAWATPRNLAGNSVDGSANVAFANKFIAQGTSDSGLSGAQFLGSLATGIVKNTATTGVLSIAASGTDYAPATSGASILKGNGAGGFSSASAGTDYAPATSGSSILYGNSAGGFNNVTIGSGVSFAGGTLSASGSGGTVTAVSVASSNGFAGTSSGGTNPSLTLTTTVTGVLKGNGTAISAAAAGTDYAPPTSGSAILKGNGSGGFSSASAGTDYAPATSGSAILKGNGSGGFNSAAAGTDYAPATSGTSILAGNGSGGFSSVTTPTGALVGTTDTQTLTNKTITGLKETSSAIGASNIDMSLGNYFSKTISGTTTFTVSNVPASGTVASFILNITNGGSATINYWSNVQWPGGTAPLLTVSGRDALGFYTYDGGATWTGLILGRDIK